MIAGVGLWALGTVGAGLCWLAFKFLATHPAYDRIATVVKRHEEDGIVGSGNGKEGNWDRSVRVVGKNKWLYLAVALDFAITLVRPLHLFFGVWIVVLMVL